MMPRRSGKPNSIVVVRMVPALLYENFSVAIKDSVYRQLRHKAEGNGQSVRDLLQEIIEAQLPEESVNHDR